MHVKTAYQQFFNHMHVYYAHQKIAYQQFAYHMYYAHKKIAY